MERDAEVGGAAASQAVHHGPTETTSSRRTSNVFAVNDNDDNAIVDDQGHPRAVKQEEDDEQQNDDNTTSTTLRPNPEPSVKRRESQAAAERSEGLERPASRKRKRGASPPWQFPTAGQTTLKSADGRRISARFSSNAAPTPIASESESRARSSSLSAPPRSSRASSPPWKKFEAEGPTSVMVDGQRKSGRVNKTLADGGQPKRVSPRSKKVADLERPRVNGAAKVISPDKGHARKVSAPSAKKVGKLPEKDANVEEHHKKIKELKAQLAALQPTRSFDPDGQAKSTHKRKRSSDGAMVVQLDGAASPPAHRKTPRASRVSDSADTSSKPGRALKLRFNPGRHNIPPPHPNALPPSPSRPPRPSIHQLLDDCDLREMQQPYMENERGPPDLAWFQQRAARQADEERTMRHRILKEGQPGGLLSKERCSLYNNVEQQPEPPPIYTHVDHLMSHVQNFRSLQIKENKEHKFLAKKIANEALEYWKKKRGPTEEDIRAEQDRVFRLIYKQVVIDVKAKWELVGQHVQNNRLKIWEAEQEIKRQERLKEKLAKSESMVARQRGALDDDSEDDVSASELAEDEIEESEEDEEASGDENMSASESGEDAGDEEEVGELTGPALEEYKARREKEREAEADDRELEADEEEDVSVVDQMDPALEKSKTPVALPPLPTSKPKPDATLADLFAAGDEEDDESEQDFEPADSESQVEAGDEDDDQPATDVDLASRRSRRSSAAAETDDAAKLSEDDSVDMDSDDYDSDEDMSSTGEEDNAQAEHDSHDSDDDSPDNGGSSLSQGLLGFYSMEDKKSKLKVASLPTPTTSAEGDVGDFDTHRGADFPADMTAGAEIEDAIADKQDDHVQLNAADDEFPPLPQDNQDPSEDSKQLQAQPVEDAVDEEITREDQLDEETERVPEKYSVPQPVLLRGTLRSYQHAGLEWLASLYRNGTNGILADEMGLGKTIQTIALLAHLAEEYGCWETHLVIVPTSVVLNWVTEFQKFLPGFRVLAYYGTSEERQMKRKGWVNDPHLDDKSKRGYNVVVTSYNIAMQDISALRAVQWHYLVLDEAHNIRNFNSQRWQILIRLKTQARLLLTGTPLQNSLTELWSLLTFLTAGDDDPAHGDLEEFLSHWRDPVREIFDAGVQTLSAEAQKVVDQLHISLRPFLLRRLKSEVEKDLPKKTESVVVCKLSKRQRQLYQEYMGLAEVKKSLAQGNAVSAGKVLLSLRRVCNHPDLFDPRDVETSWGMERSVAEDFVVKQDAIESLIGERKHVPAMLLVVGHEDTGRYAVKRSTQLNAHVKMTAELHEMEKDIQREASADPSTIEGCRALHRVHARQKKLEHLRAHIRLSDENLAAKPIYGRDLRALITVKRDSAYRVKVRPPPVQPPYGQTTSRPSQPIVKSLRAWPQFGNRPLRFESEHPSDWTLVKNSMLQKSVQTLDQIGEKLQGTLSRFAFVTPNVTAPVLDYLIPLSTQRNLRTDGAYPLETDYAHDSRIRLSIAFPDSRLLVYDSGKLQRLTYLLRDLQAKGSRSLIFTQMTGTLNILEQFLNLMGLPYLRLDGSTTPERRHLYAQEFNRPDSKYQCMILSSRAGGVGLNLTGASSVIFYDLDWNPQMDRQCMDRAHRIGQVRDVEVFKMVSEKTVEENILRRAEQKSLLDQTVIQEGHFTTDYDISKGKDVSKDHEGDEDVAAAIERVLGSGSGSGENTDKATTHALESVEDREDVAAAQRAHKEEHQDEADFGSHQQSSRATPATGLGGEDVERQVEREGHLDGYMVRLWEWLVRDVAFVPPVVKKTRDSRHRKRKR